MLILFLPLLFVYTNTNLSYLFPQFVIINDCLSFTDSVAAALVKLGAVAFSNQVKEYQELTGETGPIVGKSY